MKIKKTHKYFGLSEFMEEQNYLMDMHAQGWKLKKYSVFGGYRFEECEKEEWIYELDFNDHIDDLNDYIQLFKDCGWEYVLVFNDFYYFRKKKTDEDPDMSIFSDDVSRYDICKKLMLRLGLSMGLTCFFLLFIMIPNFVSNYEYYMNQGDTMYFIVQSILMIVMVSLIVICLGCNIKLISNMKKFKEKSNQRNI